MNEENNRVLKTERVLKQIDDFYNPWNDYIDRYIVEKDREIIENKKYNEIKNKIFWKDNHKYKFSNQFPVPINGNFYKAKYLLLYSNPGTEENEIDFQMKEELIRCFNLDKERARLVIPNEQWRSWYTKELDRFYLKNKYREIDIDDFLNQFCFINLFAYPTLSNSFDFTALEIKQLMNLETTKFAKKLVEIGIKSGKEVLVMRINQGVWKIYKESKSTEYLFEKLELKIK
ncbi:hypothetical protein [Haploplasma axanthum]|uniref:Uncharacterized protein n=1 Tax=Haploplasma axanthum TaxID=29552 RepID=A0A449BE45_HAPAX|nr:hypothetical protein [Haploplasma axanthum]VEU80580.1 Uncharacterised protein [Haploplasma axanthum]